MELNIIYNEDCLKGLKKLEEESIDLIVSDPPYGYSFMGKDWDKAVPSVEIWKECLRVLKAGAFAFIMSAPRSDVQAEMVIRLKQAGFVIGFSPIYFTFASGFPKASNISKMVDKRLGAKREIVGINEIFKKKVQAEIKRGKSNININRQMMGLSNTEAGYQNIEEVGKITAPATPQAKELDGWYTYNPKPAVEVIIVAQKPLKHKTFVSQALDYANQRLAILKEIEEELKKQGVEKIEWSKD